MGLLDPTLPDYDAIELRSKPFEERARLACQSWAVQGYGTPAPILVVYAAKVALFVGGWLLFCSRSPELGGIADVANWWLHPLAFQKAIVWSAVFEVLGLGCGSGPLTGRYMPPVGGFLYFLRRRTVKRPLFRGVPLISSARRSWLDVLLYLAFIVAGIASLMAPALGRTELIPFLAIGAALIICDRTIYLAARGEHYLVMILIFAIASTETQWIAGAMGVQAALWFFAGISKLNHHFPAVVCVMTSNSPVTRFQWLRKLMYRGYPDDLRPSRLATLMAHAGTALELSVPIILLLAPSGSMWVIVGIAMALVLHGFITSNVPMGVPIEWNVVVVYATFALFWRHQGIGVGDAGLLVGGVVLASVVAIPLIGNLWPRRVSFLAAMRYYAGNWAISLWLFRGESYRKLHENIPMTSPWIDDQLHRFYDEQTAAALSSKVVAFRLMHLHGRALGPLVSRALPADASLADYEWVEGEIVAGLVLGWNFGDGHLHDEQLLATVQDACGFEDGELRCIFVESQPLGKKTLAYRIADAAKGEIESGHIAVAELRERQPWSTAALDLKD